MSWEMVRPHSTRCFPLGGFGGLILLLATATALSAAEKTPQEQGRELTAHFYKGEFDTLWSKFSEKMRQVFVNAKRLGEFQTGIVEELGTEASVVDEKVQAKDGFQIYQRTAKFSKPKAQVMVQWTLSADGVVQGFFIRPIPEAVASELADYVTKVELRLPFDGTWFVFWGGRTLEQNYHVSKVSQRFAYDLLIHRDGSTHAGKGERNEDYYCFDQKIVAPAPGTVMCLENEVEDNVPGVMNAKQRLGNFVILDHGNNEFSFLCHIRKGTVAVKNGDVVKAGDLLGHCGNSGNSSEAHLHYHLQDSAIPFKGRGLPAPFRKYLADGKLIERGEPVKNQKIEMP